MPGVISRLVLERRRHPVTDESSGNTVDSYVATQR